MEVDGEQYALVALSLVKERLVSTEQEAGLPPESVSVVLTLRLLMSYIYMENLFLMFLDYTQRRSTVGSTPLDE
jgi:hypothetical protein